MKNQIADTQHNYKRNPKCRDKIELKSKIFKIIQLTINIRKTLIEENWLKLLNTTCIYTTIA
jgi:hypothetical protein